MLIDAYIYLITNLVNGKQYVGKTVYSIEKRFKEHIADSKRKRNSNRPLYRAFRKHGISNFKIEIIEKCDIELAADREIYWIEQYNTFKAGYNATMGGDGKLRITTATRDKVVELFYQGYLRSYIAKMLHIDLNTVTSILANCGVRRDETITKKALSRINFVPVTALDKETLVPIATFDNLIDLKSFLNNDKVASTHIHDVCHGKRQTAYGYKWRYLNTYSGIS